jgi:large subunit ribosomal protein L25
MKKLEIIGFKRANLGKKDAQQLRLEASVPCVLYGGKEVAHFHVPMILFRELVYTPEAHIVILNIEGEIREAMLQDIQFHPVNEMILHADFLELHDDRPVKIAVPTKVTGVSTGVQQGGRLVLKAKKMTVRALPANLPDSITVDITGLELGKSIKVKDLTVEGFEIMDAPNNAVLSIEVPRGLKGKQQA